MTEPWQMDVLPAGAAGGPAAGLTVTVVETAGLGPLQLLAITLTVAVPVKAAFQLTVPVAPLPLTVPAVEGDIDHE